MDEKMHLKGADITEMVISKIIDSYASGDISHVRVTSHKTTVTPSGKMEIEAPFTIVVRVNK